MAAVTTADRVNFEDLSKAADVLDMRQVPFWTRMKNGKKLENHLLYSQAIDSMGKRRSGGQPERQDIKGFEGGKTSKLYARGERFIRTPAVSTETEEFSGNSASVTLKDYNTQVTQKIKEQKRDIDYKILGDEESRDDDGIQGYKFRALGRTINDTSTGEATSTAVAADGTTPTLDFLDTQTAIPTALRTPSEQIFAGTLATDPSTDLSEDDINDMMQNRWKYAGISQDFTLWVASGLKSWISKNFGRFQANKEGYTAIMRTNVADIDKRKLVTTGIDVFEGDFGTFTVELEPWMPTTQRGYGVDMGEVMKRVAYLARHRELENKGGGRRGLIDSILSAWFGDPRKHFKIAPSTEVAAVVDFEA
jgi:hypothetical protein